MSPTTRRRLQLGSCALAVLYAYIFLIATTLVNTLIRLTRLGSVQDITFIYCHTVQLTVNIHRNVLYGNTPDDPNPPPFLHLRPPHQCDSRPCSPPGPTLLQWLHAHLFIRPLLRRRTTNRRRHPALHPPGLRNRNPIRRSLGLHNRQHQLPRHLRPHRRDPRSFPRKHPHPLPKPARRAREPSQSRPGRGERGDGKADVDKECDGRVDRYDHGLDHHDQLCGRDHQWDRHVGHLRLE